MEIEKDNPLIGVITSRTCPTCGHHEVGVISRNSTFHPLRPGTLVHVLEENPAEAPETEDLDMPPDTSPKVRESESEVRPWVPEPVRGNRPLRLKYGVILSGDLPAGQMNGKLFEAAYLQKLQQLIEREASTPVAVILDQFFAGPHLASGSPRQIALNMWQELEEIRRPVELARSWLESPDEEHLTNLIAPRTKDDLAGSRPGDEELQKELNRLSLEEFLGLLT